MDGRDKYCYLDPERVRELKEERKFTLESLAAVLCRVEHRRMSRSGEAAETVDEYEDRRKYSALKFVTRKCSDRSRSKGTEWEAAEDLALAMALGPTVLRRDEETNWQEAERQAPEYLRRMELEAAGEADCVDNLGDDTDTEDGRGNAAPDLAWEVLRGLVAETNAVLDRVRDYADDDGAPLNQLRRAGTADSAGNPPGLFRLREVLKGASVSRVEVTQIDDAVGTARRELDDILEARDRYVAERHASAALCRTRGFTADTLRQYAADCRADAEFADALDRPDEGARARDFAKRYEAFGRLLGAVQPLLETITSLINRDVEQTDALHNRLESDCEALKRKAAVVLDQADRVRHRLRTKHPTEE